jgi:hypothetical protein
MPGIFKGRKEKELEKRRAGVENMAGAKNGWVLVGEAYIQGVMQGQVADCFKGKLGRLNIV